MISYTYVEFLILSKKATWTVTGSPDSRSRWTMHWRRSLWFLYIVSHNIVEHGKWNLTIDLVSSLNYHSGDNIREIMVGLLIGGYQRASPSRKKATHYEVERNQSSATAIVLAHTRYATVHAVIEHQVGVHTSDYSTFAGPINLRRDDPTIRWTSSKTLSVSVQMIHEASWSVVSGLLQCRRYHAWTALQLFATQRHMDDHNWTPCFLSHYSSFRQTKWNQCSLAKVM